MINYFIASDIEQRALDIINILQLTYLDVGRIHFIRSVGSKSRYVVARIYSLHKIWENAIGVKPSYCIEVISERFDKASLREQDETIIHELLHIPKSFGGGFKSHRKHVTKKNVIEFYNMYSYRKQSIN